MYLFPGHGACTNTSSRSHCQHKLFVPINASAGVVYLLVFAVIMFEPHVQVLAASFGPVLPCPPYLYGVVVGPGQDFVRSGFSGDNRVCVNG